MKTEHIYHHIVFPEDCNHMGTIFGGKLVSIMDLAVAQHTIYLLKQGNGECDDMVTVAFKDIQFHIGPMVGDLLKITSVITKIGIKSVGFHITVKRVQDDQKIASGQTVFVARKNGVAHPHGLTNE